MIRRAQPGDLAEIVRLDREAPEVAHWPEPDYAAILKSVGPASGQAGGLVRQIFVAEEDAVGLEKSLRGFVLVKCVLLMELTLAEIENLAVDASARRQGIGRALMEAAMSWAREHRAERLQLEVRASNAAAIALYSSLDFAAAGRRPGYYSHPTEDAVLFDRLID